MSVNEREKPLPEKLTEATNADFVRKILRMANIFATGLLYRKTKNEVALRHLIDGGLWWSLIDFRTRSRREITWMTNGSAN